MAAVLQPSTVAASSVGGLPTELLERIILDTATEVKPPIWHSSECKKVIRWREQCESGQPTAGQFLQIRLVCRKVCATARRAFGRVLDEAVFDLGSRDSIYHLHAIAGR